MTLPHERTRAVCSTRDFLVRLMTPYAGGIKRIPAEVRTEARRLLKHFPNWVDMTIDNQFDAEAAREFGKRQTD